MTDTATLIAHADLTDTARALLTMVVERGRIAETAGGIAAQLAVSDRTVFRASVELERAGLITRESARGRGGCLRLTPKPDIDTVLRRLCHGLGRSQEPPPGQEYTRLMDEEAARRDRARYCHATGTGPKWARELGAAMARGEA